MALGAEPVGADPTLHSSAPAASDSRTSTAPPTPADSSTPTPGSSTSTPNSTPSAVVPTDVVPTESGDEPGWFDLSGQVRKAINDFILWVARTGLKPVLGALGHTVLSTPDLTGNPQVRAVWTTCLVAANAIFVLFVVAGGFLVASRETLQNRYGLKEVAPRIVVAGVAANTSLLVCGNAIGAANALTAAIVGQGVDGHAAATALEQTLNQQIQIQASSIVVSLLVLAVLVMAVVVIVTFILRVAMLVLLIGVAPLALLCHASPHTEGLAYAWWRALAACLAIQLGQAVILLATLRVFLTPAGPEALGLPTTTSGLLGVLVCLTMLWLLIKLPGWTKHLVLGQLGRRQGRGLVGEVIHAVVMLKTLGALAAGTTRASRPRGTRPVGPPAGTPGPSPSGPTPAGSGLRPRPRPGPHSGPRPGPTPSRPSRGGGVYRPRRPAPPPAGPAAFSHAPVAQAPLPAPAGSTTPPAFSSSPRAATARSSASSSPPGPPAPARFSDPATPTPGTGHTGTRPAPAGFSHTPTPATARRATRAAPPTAFSDAPAPQTAPRRPPAPATPLFSSPAPPTPPPESQQQDPGRDAGRDTGWDTGRSSARRSRPSRPSRHRPTESRPREDHRGEGER